MSRAFVVTPIQDYSRDSEQGGETQGAFLEELAFETVQGRCREMRGAFGGT